MNNKKNIGKLLFATSLAMGAVVATDIAQADEKTQVVANNANMNDKNNNQATTVTNNPPVANQAQGNNNQTTTQQVGENTKNTNTNGQNVLPNSKDGVDNNTSAEKNKQEEKNNASDSDKQTKEENKKENNVTVEKKDDNQSTTENKNEQPVQENQNKEVTPAPFVAEPNVAANTNANNNISDNSVTAPSTSTGEKTTTDNAKASIRTASKVTVDNFRFTQTEKVYSFAKKDIEVKDGFDGKGKVVGKLKKGNLAYILTDLGNGYFYIESGNVRGFVKAEDLIQGDEAKAVLTKLKEEQKVSKDEDIDFSKLLGESTVKWYDNDAFTFTRTTTQKVTVPKKYALTNTGEVIVREEAKDDAREIGKLNVKSLSFVIEEKDGWVYIESGSVRGFVKASDIRFDDDTQKEVNKNGESRYESGSTTVEITKNKALYHSLTSVKEAYNEKHFSYNGKSNPNNTYPWGQCTWGVKELAPWVGNNWGNANQWLNSGQAAGFQTGNTPKVGSVAVFTGEGGGYGHVAVVIEVNGDKIKIMEANYGGSALEANPRGIGEYRGWIDPVASGVTGYIYPNSDSQNENVVDVIGEKEKSSKLIAVPEKLGHIYTYMGWQTITAPDSQQYKLREKAGMTFDDEGYGIIDGRYVVATTTTFGEVGDKIDIYLEDGTILPAIIGDIKNQSDAGATKWGHQDGSNMIEFVVDKDSWYPSHSNPGTDGNHKEWSQYLEKVVNNGNYFDKLK